MRTKKGTRNYKIPSYSSIVNVCNRGKDYDVILYRIGSEEMLSMDFTNMSYPSMYSIIGSEIFLWPTPDKNYEIRIIYAPALEVF